MIELGRAMHAEAPALCIFPFDEGKVEAALRHALEHGCAFVHEKNGAIDAGFVGILTERWFSKRVMLIDLALFVQQDRRGGLLAARLIIAAVEWAKEKGLQPEDVQLGVSTGVRPEVTGALYERLGFECFGGLYRLKEF